MKSRRIAIFVIFGALLLSACGGGTEPESAAPESTTSTAAPETTTTKAPETTVPVEIVLADWSTRANVYRNRVGDQLSIDCPPEGAASSIWGVEIYTDDSSICTAAVHVGLLNFADGGRVLIEIAPGEDAYLSGSANDVESNSWPSWSGSFVFPDAPPGTGDFVLTTTTTTTAPATTAAVVESDGWSEQAPASAAVGDLVEVTCEAGGEFRSVWGSGPYTGDSSICTAAVHAGIITVEEGGVVTATVSDGEDAYTGSEANGVTTRDWPSFGRSFTFS